MSTVSLPSREKVCEGKKSLKSDAAGITAIKVRHLNKISPCWLNPITPDLSLCDSNLFYTMSGSKKKKERGAQQSKSGLLKSSQRQSGVGGGIKKGERRRRRHLLTNNKQADSSGGCHFMLGTNILALGPN